MRDPARIPTIWQAFERAHSIYPDWRFGQFLVNFIGWYGRDPFFPEDDAWMKIIDQYIAVAGAGRYDPNWASPSEKKTVAKSKKTVAKAQKSVAKAQKSTSKSVKPKDKVTTGPDAKQPKKPLKTQKKAGTTKK